MRPQLDTMGRSLQSLSSKLKEISLTGAYLFRQISAHLRECSLSEGTKALIGVSHTSLTRSDNCGQPHKSAIGSTAPQAIHQNIILHAKFVCRLTLPLLKPIIHQHLEIALLYDDSIEGAKRSGGNLTKPSFFKRDELPAVTRQAYPRRMNCGALAQGIVVGNENIDRRSVAR